ncbi:hypothetical protein HHK36_019404 [Tetracentron sinense]|uniref:Uncharacterized protein n=1 Tax=Tetracentron sinense TaxID=13715 RepID=A0A835D9K8_TETSI|nr:hypothetical protein HHK36_019404 [Tetracentron sinense]
MAGGADRKTGSTRQQQTLEEALFFEIHTQELCTSVRITDAHVHEAENQLQLHSESKDLLLKPYGDDTLETKLMRLHNLSGLPRFLFTIKEETKEDLVYEDGKSRCNRSRKGSRSKSLSYLLLAMDTPYLTPLSSPPIFPPLTPLNCYNLHGFNPLFESSTNSEFNRIKFSPPPKFHFLKDRCRRETQ